MLARSCSIQSMTVHNKDICRPLRGASCEEKPAFPSPEVPKSSNPRPAVLKIEVCSNYLGDTMRELPSPDCVPSAQISVTEAQNARVTFSRRRSLSSTICWTECGSYLLRTAFPRLTAGQNLLWTELPQHNYLLPWDGMHDAGLRSLSSTISYWGTE